VVLLFQSQYYRLFETMRRSTYFQRLVIFGLSGPIVALNIWLLSQAFRYFEHLITLTVAAILAFAELPGSVVYADSHHSGSGSILFFCS